MRCAKTKDGTVQCQGSEGHDGQCFLGGVVLADFDRVAEARSRTYVDIVFDGPAGREGGRFVEVEDPDGESIRIGEWVTRPDGYHALRIPDPREVTDVSDDLETAWKWVEFGRRLVVERDQMIRHIQTRICSQRGAIS